MLDRNWELVDGDAATRIEILNYTNQINVLFGLMTFLIAHGGPLKNGRPPMPDEAAIKHLHHAGTLFLLSDPGQYRNIEVVVATPEEVIHTPPAWQDVPGEMQRFFRNLSSVWTSGDALDVAAYALWRINWIHPFRNGNGRTARAFSYACLNLHLGVILPGSPTVIDQIMANRDRYQESLRVADLSFEQTGIPDLAPMKQFLNDLLQVQVKSMLEAEAEAK